MIVLGIDPGLNTTGYGVLDFVKHAGIQRVAIAVKAAPDQP